MKKYIFIFIIGLMILYMLIYPANGFIASTYGLKLWLFQIVPTLLPFSLLSGFILGSHLIKTPNWAVALTLLCGLLFGFPMGSIIAVSLYKEQTIPKDLAEQLCVCCNNLSPAFVMTYVCSQQLQMPQLAYPMMFILYGPPMLLGITLLVSQKKGSHKKAASRFQINMQIIDAGIISSFSTLIKLCGYIVLFSIMAQMILDISILPISAKTVTIGLLEVTNGIARLSESTCSTHLKWILSLGFLSFGGICGIAQTGSIMKTADLSLIRYVRDKIILAIVSMSMGIFYLEFR